MKHIIQKEILEPKSWFILIHDHDPEHLKNIFLKNDYRGIVI